ncbi:CG31612 [Drosophila busckii]|uniref:CG31612 n=1 Tax=Drosophila busckii TaxID=30019 RepID=A0A0M3QU07_DROBS|nr:CG31612 [Drosophila busckii]
MCLLYFTCLIASNKASEKTSLELSHQLQRLELNLEKLQERCQQSEKIQNMQIKQLSEELLKLKASHQQIEFKHKQTAQHLKSLRALNQANRQVFMLKFTQIRNKYYYIEEEEQLPWIDAAIKCQQLSGHLANLQSELELKALANRLRRQNYWIDINDRSTEGRYVSLAMDANKVSYFNWHLFEPNNYDHSEHCVELKLLRGKYAMNDKTCESRQYFICELPQKS